MPVKTEVMGKKKDKLKPRGSKPKQKLEQMSVDEFLTADFEDDSESSSSSKTPDALQKTNNVKKSVNKEKLDKSVQLKQKSTKASKKNIKETNKKSVNSAEDVGQKSSDLMIKKKKKSKASGIEKERNLKKVLEETDPEFFKFLKDEDKGLLSNLDDLSDASSDQSDEESEVIDEAKTKQKKHDTFEKELIGMSSGESDSEDENSSVHKLPEKLEVASDDSEDEEENEIDTTEGNTDMAVDDDEPVTKKNKKGILITNKMLNEWSEQLKEKPNQAILRQVFSAFHAAVQEAGGAETKANIKYRVEGGNIFNSIVRLCLERVAPSLQSMLRISSFTSTSINVALEKSNMWKKLKANVKIYLTNILSLLSQLSEPAMVTAILKHAHKLILFYAHFPTLSKQLMKKMIKLWTGGEETTRVVAFLCLNKLVHLKKDALLETCLKQMYMAYVSNCKFTSPTTLPLINFMQSSLVEIFNIDQTMAYQYAFIYIRQLAIHLRNAISVKKKTTCQAVYNWQYIHCLALWVKLITTTHPSDILEPMIYPLTQTIIGTIKLLPNARYFPLRFHCVKLLNSLSSKTNTFIPTLPFLLEVIDQIDFNKRHKTLSMKPFNFAIILKFSKSQLHEKAFKDGLIDQLYELFLESYHNQCCSIGFPELIVPSIIQLKEFLKKCKIANYCKQIKQIVDKSMEQAKFVTEKRKNCGIQLDNVSAISQWEKNLRGSGTPLTKFYSSWRKLRDRELQHEISNKEAISGAAIDIPVIERKLMRKATPQDKEEFSKLFEDEADSDDDTRFLLKEERPDSKKKKRKRDESDSDDYSDFDSDELEQLAQSASSGDESDNMENGDCSDDEEEVDSEDLSDEESNDEKISNVNKSAKNKIPHRNGHTPSKKPKLEEDNSNSNDDIVEDFKLSAFDSD